MSELNMRPGIRYGAYPQRSESRQSEFEQACYQFFERIKASFSRRLYSQRFVIRQINRHEQRLLDYSDGQLKDAVEDLRAELFRHGLQKKLIWKSFATIREVSGRLTGKRHFDVQLFGGWIMMNGMLAEMDTGEGKTLTTTLPACTAALAGIPVHVITANDYLAARDAEEMLPLYEKLGLRGASVVDGMDVNECRQKYRDDIVHTTNKQVAFDYLRDRIEMGDDTGDLRLQFRQIQNRVQPRAGSQLILGGLCFALVDEADSVLIDEAKTPLIITKTLPSEVGAETYADALYLASTLFEEEDYSIDDKTRAIEFTLDGEDNLEELTSTLPKIWRNKRRREMLVKQALSAQRFYKKDHDYVVNEGQVQIIDQSTGRLMPDRSWEQGLHQMVEAKEGCTISDPREPQARISYQRFFSRYLRLGGTSGTISEVAGEVERVYGLDVIKVATNQPSKRIMLPELLYRDEAAKRKALISRIKTLYNERRPVLIGTCSVAESEQVSEWLLAEQLNHRVLNAKQDKYEAEIISEAGAEQSITVATNMAGRGTDISLTDEVKKLGGLHVIAISQNESRRVDRQLYGRCARQGAPGSAEAILSLEDPVLANHYSPAMLKWFSSLIVGDGHVPVFISKRALRLPQLKNERDQARARKSLMKQDKQLRRVLAFSGKFE